MQPITPQQVGEYLGYWHKVAGVAPPQTVHSLAGRLYVTPKNWGLLSVPNSLIRGAFDALHEIGLELPYNADGRLNAHISVFRPEDIELIGGADKIQERGHTFSYTLGPLQVVEPEGWKEMDRAYFIKVISPELEDLRKSYGLAPRPKDGKHDFHITVAVRKRKVLRHNDVVKQSSFEEENAEAKEKAKDSILPHVRDGMFISGCGKRYYAKPEDNKCPCCGTGVMAARSFKRATADILPGGLADGKPDSAFKLESLIEGRKVESEHTSSKLLTNEIAKDHLTEDPKYYKKLKKIEGKEAKFDGPMKPKTPADWNDPADREDCPHCGVMHERGDGYCNSCGERWPAVSAEKAASKILGLLGR